MNRSAAAVFCFFAFLSPARAQKSDARRRPAAKSPAAAPAETKLPSKEDIEAGLQRTLGYDRSVGWEIFDIRPSIIPGVAEVIVSINKQPPNRLFISPDGQNAIVVGDIIPFGPNPFAPARAKLRAADGPALGPDAPVISLVEFSDLECPHCKAAQPILEKLASDFPQVRIVFQQFPLPASLHPWAMKAALHADCAAQTSTEAFWKFTDSIFENQGSIALATADDKLKELATAAGLDAEKIAACAAAPETEARVKKSMDLGQSLEVTETPTVFINGRRVKGVATIPYDQLKNLVQFEIEHAGK
ncbi:MAG TPA: thioredoxin domain-containing protein [Candidatus Acidoferrales bacterium]|nr:thioredoxin domain-containing protein [Candidatus Acidoferrales bacterium]